MSNVKWMVNGEEVSPDEAERRLMENLYGVTYAVNEVSRGYKITYWPHLPDLPKRFTVKIFGPKANQPPPNKFGGMDV